jgi:hypothetical protein
VKPRNQRLGLSKNTVIDIVKRDRLECLPYRRSWVMKSNRLRRAERGMPTCPFVNRHPKASFAAALNVLKIPFRVLPVERLEDHFGPVQLVLRFPGQGVQFDALGVGQRLDAALDPDAIDAPALDRLPFRDDPRARFGDEPRTSSQLVRREAA